MSKSSLPVILVIDSNVLSLAATREIFHFHDFDVHGVHCRDAAIEAARSLPLDLVICDLNLDAGVDGRSIVREICAIPDRHDVPVMFASSGQIPDVIRRKHDFGGAYHLKKPFDPEVLIELVERALWMPALVQSHIARPHFKIGPAAPLAQADSDISKCTRWHI